MVAWLTVEDVAAAGNISAANVTGNAALASATAAAVAFVERQRRDLATGQEPAFDAPADVKHGAAMLAARLYERRGALLGVTASAGFEGAAEILRYDPDIEQLLGIGRYRPFGFGAPTT